MQRGRSEATEARADAEHANHRRRHEQGDAASAVPDGAGVGASGSTDDASDGENIFERFTLDQTRRFGQGAYGVTFAASDTANGGRPCAVKVINTTKLRGPNAVARCRSECLILENLSHPNVIRVLGHGTGRQSSGQDHLYFIFMELASGGELFDEVISSGALGEAVTRNFMRQILAGVEHCHARGVAHRDLKLENMLLTEEGVLKIIDFGLSHVYPRTAGGAVDRSMPLLDVAGSPAYCAPEVRARVGYDGFTADVWSLGVCLFAMLSGFFPLEESSDKDPRFVALLAEQSKGKSSVHTVYGWYRQSCAHLSPPVVELLDGMLAMSPTQRLTLHDVLAHRWFDAPPDAPVEDEPVFRSMSSGSAASARLSGDLDEEAGGGLHAIYRGADLDDEDAPSRRPPGLSKQPAMGEAHQSFWVH